MKKRLLAILMALALVVSLLPVGVLAADGDGASGGYTYNDKETAYEKTKVTANKTVTENEDGTYTVTLSVQGYTTPTSDTRYLPADIVLVVDTSTSMNDTVYTYTCGGTEFTYRTGTYGKWVCQKCGDKVGGYTKPTYCRNQIKVNRLDVAKEAASQFVSGLLDASDDIRIGLYDFSGSNRTDVALTSNETTLLNAIDNLSMPRRGDGTDYGLGLDGAEDILKNSSDNRSKFIVFLSDGEPQNRDNGVSEANALKKAGVTIFTVGIDTGSTGSAANALKKISSKDEDGNAYFYAASSDGSSGSALNDILAQISETIQGSIQAGTDAVMTDVINTDSFELVSGNLSEGLTASADGTTLTWNIGDITSTEETVSFNIKLKDNNTSTDAINTNSDVKLTFDSTSTGTNVTFNKGAIGDPTVNVYSVTYTDGVDNEAVFADQVTYNLREGENTPAFNGTPTRDGFTFVGWSPTVAKTVTGNVTYTAVWEANDPEMDPKATDITIEVVLDGVDTRRIQGSSINDYISVEPYQNLSETGDETWNCGTYNNGTVTYSVTYYDCKDIGFSAQDGYVIEAIDAQTVFGQSGSKGIYAIDSNDELAEYGDYMADNVKGNTTVTVYVRTLYTVDYYVNGTAYDGDTDTGYYVSGITYDAGDVINTAPTNPSGDDYYPVDCGCDEGEEEHTGYTDVNGAQPGTENLYVVSGLDTDITFISLPDNDNGAYNVAGWYLGQNGNTGTTYSGTQNVSTFISSVGEDRIIKFNATYAANTYDVTYSWSGLPTDGTALYDSSGNTVAPAEPSDASNVPNGTYTVDSTYTSSTVYYTHDQYGNVNGSYTFSGWKVNNEGEPVTTVTINGADVALVGVWTYQPQTVDTHTVTFEYILDDETKLKNDEVLQNVTHNSTVDIDTYYTHEITVGDNHYTWIARRTPTDLVWVNEDEGQFSVTGDITITFVYSLDNWDENDDSEEGGDGTPDKYQVLVKYTASNGGSIADNANTTEVLTIRNADEEYTESGTVTATGSTAVADDTHFFDRWTQSVNGQTATGTELGAATGEIELKVSGGDVITYTAYFTEKTYDLNVEKILLTVGDTLIEEGVEIPTVDTGDVIMWNIVVTNNGNQTLTNITVTDTIVNGSGDVTLTGTDDTRVNINGAIATIDSLNAGESVTITASYTVVTEDAGKTLNNTATVEDNDGHVDNDTPDEGIPVTEPTPEPTTGLDVTKTVSDRTPDVGDRITYTITVRNTGNTDVDNITVTDTFWGNGVDYAYVGNTRYDVSDGNMQINLDAGDSVVITYTYRVRYADEGDRITNIATVTTPGVPSDSSSVTIDVDDITPNIPGDDDDDTVYVPNWLNTSDHYAYIVGYEDGTIKPENNITRAEVATIFFRLLTDNARARFWSSENSYTDVAAESWYNNAISTLSRMGIINGYEDGSFRPNAPITRAEFTAIATRFFDYTARYAGAFNDVASGSWYADYVQAAVDMGLVDGYPDGGFHPNSYITRAEAVTIVNRVLNRVPHEDHLLSTSVMNTWPDNRRGTWYYADMQEATNSHDYDWIRVSGERVEDWTAKLPERDWAALEQQWSTAYSG